jgi:hypothetical protein
MSAALSSILLAFLICVTLTRASSMDEMLQDPVPLNPLHCDTCRFVAGFIIGWLHQNNSAEILEKEIDKFCSIFSNGTIKDKCLSFGKAIHDNLPLILYWQNVQDLNDYTICCMLSYCTVKCCKSDAPEQIHIGLASSDLSLMTVTWVSLHGEDSIVQYGTSSSALNLTATGYSQFYPNGGWIGWVHYAVLEGLKPLTKYYYRVGGRTYGWSRVYSFTTYTQTNYQNIANNFIVLGDMGWDPQAVNTISILKSKIGKERMDLIIHNGDISYSDGVQHRFDGYMRDIEYFAAQIPYMVSTGNHEVAITSLWNDSTFPFRFSMPKPHHELSKTIKPVDVAHDFFVGNGSTPIQNEKLKEKYRKYYSKLSERFNANRQRELPFLSDLYYSFDYGNVHWVAIDTESELDTPFVSDVQVEWLKNDLRRANQNRHRRPWIIVFGHRALYCSNYDTDCTLFADYLKHKLEDVLYTYKVDLVIGAHKHEYERGWAIYKERAYKSYHNPKAPVYILNGAGGNREGFSPYLRGPPDWIVFRTHQWGYNVITVHNATTLTCHFYENAHNQLVDSFTIVKDAP